MSSDPEAKARNLLDRAAYFDGQLDALSAFQSMLLSAIAEIEALGPMPRPDGNPMEVVAYQMQVAALSGSLFRRLGDRLQDAVSAAKDRRELLLRDKATDLDGEAMH